MKFASFNVLADSYTSYGDYSHVDATLLQPGARTSGLETLISSLDADVIGLQEAELPLVDALDETENWQTFWAQKGRNKPDGCVLLVRHGLTVHYYEAHNYDDESGHVFQAARIGRFVVANTHVKWAPADEPEHIGLAQTKQLLSYVDTNRPTILMGDFNDTPGGPVRSAVEAAGFENVWGDEPTAVVNGSHLSLDVLATRGLRAARSGALLSLETIPDVTVPSDHIPILAEAR